MKSKKKFKLRYIVIPLIGVVLLFMCYTCLPGSGIPMEYEIAHFGKSSTELYSFQTLKEKKVGKEIVERAKFCMEYNGDEQSAPETDELARYYYFPSYDRPSRTEVKINLVKCVIHGKRGSVWFRYSLRSFGNGICTHGSWNILTRCTIEKDDSGDWIVTNVNEPP